MDDKTLQSGELLGPYRIEFRLGAGGMGEVYRAVDTRLGRAVAVKVLPAHLSDDEETRRRFEREAKLVSSLQHPHICTLFDIGHQDGVDFLVMELLEGETLAARLEKGPLSLRQVLRQATEIADALEAAHQKGVVHRDLKPGNVMLTAPPDESGSSGSVRLPRERDAGMVKLLDFGLAKLRPELASDSEAAEAATAQELAETVTEALASTLSLDQEGRGAHSVDLTQRGTIVGTLPYMAPEQFQGSAIDARTDVFAFGAVLYEMATGRRAFPQTHPTSLVAAILERDPEPASELRFDLPPMLSSLCARCLAKHPADRWQSMRDVGMVLRDLSATWSQSGVGPMPKSDATLAERSVSRSLRALASLALVTLLAGLAFFVGKNSSDPVVPVETPPLVRFELPPMPGEMYDVRDGPVKISPDGLRLAYVSKSLSGDRWDRIALRTLDESAVETIVAEDEGPYDLFWSSDGRSLGFFSGARDELVRLDLGGGPPLPLAKVIDGRGASWHGDTILFTRSASSPILRISADGGADPVEVTSLDAGRGDEGHWRPSFLPDGRRFLFVAHSQDPKRSGLHLGSLDGDEPRRIGDLGGPAEWVEWNDDNWLLFLQARHLLARRLDTESLRWLGSPVQLAQNLSFVPRYQSFGFSISQTGLLAYQSDQAPVHQASWLDREGQPQGGIGRPGDANLDLSLDGRWLALERVDPQESATDIWILDLERGFESRLTSHPFDEIGPVISPDGDRVAFSSFRQGVGAIHLVEVATGAQTQLKPDFPRWVEVVDWSADGRYLMIDSGSGQASDLAVYDLETGTKTRGLDSEAQENSGRFSADGQWVAFESDASGREEIYITRFPVQPHQGRYRVSIDGGHSPRWRGDGSELFFIEPARSTAMVVELELPTGNGDPSIGRPRDLFEIASGDWVVAPDGQRFLVSAVRDDAPAAPITVLLGWQTLLDEER